MSAPLAVSLLAIVCGAFSLMWFVTGHPALLFVSGMGAGAALCAALIEYRGDDQ